MKMMKANKNFTPCVVDDGDELYPNGIFLFNITKMLEYIRKNPDRFPVQDISLQDFPAVFSSINESHIDTVDITRPVLLAEIAPGWFNLIDGHHRLEKAKRQGKQSLTAFKINSELLSNFLVDKKAYFAYIEYWNEKVKKFTRNIKP